MTNNYSQYTTCSERELIEYYHELRQDKNVSGSSVKLLLVHPTIRLYCGFCKDINQIFLMFQSSKDTDFNLTFLKPWLRKVEIVFDSLDTQNTCHHLLFLEEAKYEQEFIKIVKLVGEIINSFGRKELIINNITSATIAEIIDFYLAEIPVFFFNQ